MTAQAPALSATDAARQVRRTQINRFALWLFFLSDGLLFAILAAARFYINGTHTPDDLNQYVGLLITSVLLLSSYTAFRGETAIAHGNIAHGRLMLALTALIGAAFAIGVGIEWSIAEFDVSEGYGTSFFSMTGMHAAHVISGVGLLLIAVYRAGRGEYSAQHHWGVSAIVMYWHFVDVVWVFFYPTLYLVQ
jgi:cytochrome c oxidase subunit 3